MVSRMLVSVPLLGIVRYGVCGALSGEAGLFRFPVPVVERSEVLGVCPNASVYR